MGLALASSTLAFAQQARTHGGGGANAFEVATVACATAVGCWSARPSLGASAVPSAGCGAGIRCAEAVGLAEAFCAEQPHP